MSKWKWIPVALVSALAGGSIAYTYAGLERSELSKLERAMDMIETGYLEPVDRTKLIDGAIDGMLKSLEDPYTTYMNQEEAEAFYQSINASFEGIGATMEEIDGRIVVVAPIKGSPAEAAGVKPGDQVVKVGEKSLEGLKVHEAVLLIRGKKGTTAELTILRDGREIKLSIVRDTIPLQTVYAELREDGVGVIRIASFAEKTAAEFETEAKRLLAEGMKALVIDMRQNPGGVTDAAQAIAETLVEDGKPIVQFKRRGVPVDIVRSDFRDIGIAGLPVAAVIDGGSASAAEIVAGALQQSAGVPLVGEKTFGKGTAQLSQPFRDGSSMKMTVAEWLTPNGDSIQDRGLAPDHEVKLPPYAALPLVSDELVMKENEFSDDIRAVQTMLKSQGFDPGREDGFFDAKTADAVRRYQASKQLERTGVVTGETTRALIADVRETIRANDTQLEAAAALVKERLRQ
ncbi:S41 family peptidase [Paenibacillus sp.]|uniref:S41 family peptidase n=1 Tax=Paenibacillus sp. TaxID=58172 RepID=UPI002D3C18A4|nr:S41 family peptidase [Paenibacillus sp.]HZG57097.1 S41 family peptidase [Paenibacillus sp.]